MISSHHVYLWYEHTVDKLGRVCSDTIRWLASVPQPSPDTTSIVRHVPAVLYSCVETRQPSGALRTLLDCFVPVQLLASAPGRCSLILSGLRSRVFANSPVDDALTAFCTVENASIPDDVSAIIPKTNNALLFPPQSCA
jgi:hypothetical protein